MDVRIFNQAKNKKILVLGDYCIDEFLEGEAENVSPEAPILRVLVDKTDTNLGMAGNIAAGLKALGAEVYAAGVIGDDSSSKKLVEKLKLLNINIEGMIFQQGRITPKFSRIIVGGKKYPKQSALRFDVENTNEVDLKASKKITSFVRLKKDILDAIVVADYDEVGKGTVSDFVLEELRKLKSSVILIGNSRNNFGKFKNFNCCVQNLHEAELTYGKKAPDDEIANDLIRKLSLDMILITKDKDGMIIYNKNMESASFPAFAKTVKDVAGAGDSVISAFTYGLCLGLDYKEAAELASYSAAISVSRPRVSVVTLTEIENFINPDMQNIK